MDDLFVKAKRDFKMNRRIFIMFEGSVTEQEYLDALKMYSRRCGLQMTISSIDRIELIGSETDLRRIETRFVDYLKNHYHYLLRDAKFHHDLFVYMMDFDRLRVEYDPSAPLNCQRLIQIASSSKMLIYPLLSDPSFEFWLYILSAGMQGGLIENPRSGKECHEAILRIVPEHIRATSGMKSYTELFYRYILNDGNIRNATRIAQDIRRQIGVLSPICRISNIVLNQQILLEMQRNLFSVTMADLLLKEIFDL